MNARFFYASIYRIRRVEEEIAKIYPTDKIQSPVHLAIGQESVSVGICAALDQKDVVFGTYRSHALYLAKGGDLDALIGELCGKASGCSKGKGGSMHVISPEHGVMGTSGVVASTLSHAVGYAYALKLKKSRNAAVSFFGDGASEEGVFFESINFAALKKLPVIFICENNGWAVHARQEERQSGKSIAEKAAQFGIPVKVLDGRDVHQLYQEMRQAVELIRNGQTGPSFFECRTSRWKEHVGPAEDFHFGYRSRDEMKPWIDSDPVKRLRAELSEDEALAIEAEMDEAIRRAFQKAEQDPAPGEEALWEDVVKES